MARPKRPFGNCCICGTYAQLSFEHVPPQAADNDKRVEEIGLDEFDALFDDPSKRVGAIQQRGVGFFSLCTDCNNRNGTDYIPHYLQWHTAGKTALAARQKDPHLPFKNFSLSPLPVVKEIVAMFLSVNGPQFAVRHPTLAAFVLDKDATGLPSPFRLFAYHAYSENARVIKECAMFNIVANTRAIVSEISKNPFGYILLNGDGVIDCPAVDVTHFASFTSSQRLAGDLFLPIFHTHTILPLDYRSAAEIASESRADDGE